MSDQLLWPLSHVMRASAYRCLHMHTCNPVQSHVSNVSQQVSIAEAAVSAGKAVRILFCWNMLSSKNSTLLLVLIVQTADSSIYQDMYPTSLLRVRMLIDPIRVLVYAVRVLLLHVEYPYIPTF